MESVTIKDIARLAGVSCATVSRTLNGDAGVGAETRARVLALCREHGYRRNQLARSLSASRAGLIGCILSDLDNPLFAEMSLLLERGARQHGYHVMLCHGRVEDTDIRQLFDFLIGHRVDGIILASYSRQAPQLIRQYADRVPIVLQGIFDLPAAEIPVRAVSVDNLAGGRLAAEYLYGLGHREIVYLGLRETNASHALRYQGFAETARHLGMTLRVLPNEEFSSTIDVGYRLAKRFFFENFRETAMFAACDSLALGAMAAAREFRISVPEELSILGFDDISYAALPHIRLSTIAHEKQQLAETTLDCLLERIESPDPGDLTPRLLRPSLLERASCRRL